jgi:3',5'-cyclic AMP phosphodiesterase CpdA
MRVIAQISDLHFGYNDPSLAAALRQSIVAIKPNVLVVSGDLVEHATDDEFRSARQFLDSLPEPQIVVPGNHDLPFYNLFRRFTEGLAKYRKYITDQTEPTFTDDEIAIIGADSAHLYPVKGGKITGSQLDDLVQRFANLPPHLIRILVTHHPFDLPEPSNPRLLIGHSRRAVTRLAPVVDILLAGHVHISSAGSTSGRYKLEGHAMAFVQAGTAISGRYKGEANSFNVLQTDYAENREKRVIVHRYAWMKEQERFVCDHSVEYRLGEKGWAEFRGRLQPRSDASRFRPLV